LFALQLAPLSLFGGMRTLVISGEPEEGAIKTSWAFISVAPQATLAAAASALVPLAIFNVTLRLPYAQRLQLCWLLIALGAISLILGFLQVAHGPQSELRFYSVTSLFDAVGFFANRNHFASQLYVTLVLGALWLASVLERQGDLLQAKTRTFFVLVISALFLLATVVGLALTHSRSGVVLAIAALGGSFFLIVCHGLQHPKAQHGKRKDATRVYLWILLLMAIFVAQFGLQHFLRRFQLDMADDLRWIFNRTAIAAAFNALPFGLGFGAFVDVYAAAEKGGASFFGYANRAHNDFAELFLEAGLIGAVIVAAFMSWLLLQCFRIWWRGRRGGVTAMERAASLIVLLLLAHSLVDYPLRTCALSVIFAFCCAVLAAPVEASPASGPSLRSARSKTQTTTGSEPGVFQGWGGEVSWPEPWVR
jgi:O-antigen ligase